MKGKREVAGAGHGGAWRFILLPLLLCLALGLRLPAQATPPMLAPRLEAVLETPPPIAPPPPVSPAALQRPLSSQAEVEETQIFHPLLRLELPGPQVLFTIESELQFRERLKQEARTRPGGVSRGRLEFPDDRIVLSKDRAPSRNWQQQVEVVEPYYVGYYKLYFNQINMSRYGWDFGILAPLTSCATFFIDFATMPYQFWLSPCRCYEYNSGLFLPGDAVPLLLYPPRTK